MQVEGLVRVSRTPDTGAKGADLASRRTQDGHSFPVQNVPVARIRPEDGLGRKRDRDGHRELQRSIEQFGVLTPITVREAPDGSGDYLLIKGQGRTLACRLLGIATIPAMVVDGSYAEAEKVQQFLVENVARLKMRPVDRALLIHRARQRGEETASIAARFGLSPATVRRLLAQLDGATSSEVAALKSGEVNLAIHGVIARHVDLSERAAVVDVVAKSRIKTKELEALFVALGWRRLTEMGRACSEQRIVLIAWACSLLDGLPPSSIKDRIRQVALQFPTEFSKQGTTYGLVAQ